jgi:hypothetical protein
VIVAEDDEAERFREAEGDRRPEARRIPRDPGGRLGVHTGAAIEQVAIHREDRDQHHDEDQDE